MEQIAISNKSDKPAQLPTKQQQAFVGTFIALSWQLLVVVLVPFIGGHFIDQKTGKTPLFTLIGLAVALASFALVTYRAYQSMARLQKESSDD